MTSGITFYNTQGWIWALLAAALLLPLAWRSLKPGAKAPFPWAAFAARTVGILLLGLILLDPHLVSQRPVAGANALAIVADNSESLRIKERSEIIDRGESMRQWLSGRHAEWLDEVGKAYQVRNYQFDRALRRIGSFEALDFRGDRSNLAAALDELGRRLETLPVAGIALFTDGNATDAAELPSDLSRLPPLFPIIAGAEDQQPDIAVTDVQLRQSAFDDAPLDLSATIATTGLGGEPVELALSRLSVDTADAARQNQEEPVETQRFRARDGQSEAARFQWRPIQTGVQFYRLSARAANELEAEEDASAPPAEATRRNNQRLIMADRGKSQYRILYVGGRPNWEYKYLNRALADDPQLDLVALMRVADREPKFEFKGRSGESSNPLYRGFGREDETERYDQAVLVRLNTRDERELAGGFPTEARELFEYDAIVLDDVEADFFTFAQLSLLRDFVNQRGGGLLVLGGANSLDDGGYAGSPLESALPLYLDSAPRAGQPEASLSWDLTRDGWVEPWARLRPMEADEQRRLDQMPDLKVFNALPRVKPGARALAVVDNGLGETYPALVIRNFGAGRVACITIGDLWRWGLRGPVEQVDLARFWRQTSRWLVKDAPQRLQLLSETQPNGDVRLLATARDAEFLPLELGHATLTVRRVAADSTGAADDPERFRSVELPMEPVSGKPGQFMATAPLRDAGAYLASVEVLDASGESLGVAETGWVSEPAAAEFASVSPNRDLLERLAAATGGRVLEPEELNQLPEELANRPSPHMETWARPLWHSHWVFALALGCLLAEWAIRRRKGYA